MTILLPIQKELSAKECAKLLRSLRRQHKFEEVNTFCLGYEQPKRTKKHEFGKPYTRDYQIFRCEQQFKQRIDIAFQMKVCRYVDKYITSHGITNKTNFLESKSILEQYVLDLVQFIIPLCKPKSIVMDKMSIEIEYDEKRNVCYADLNCEMTVDEKKEHYISAYSTTQIANPSTSSVKCFVSFFAHAFEIFNNIALKYPYNDNPFLISNVCHNMKIDRANDGSLIRLKNYFNFFMRVNS